MSKIETIIKEYPQLFWFSPLGGILLALSYPNLLSANGFWGVEYLAAFFLLLTLFAPTYKLTVTLAFLSGLLFFGCLLYWMPVFGVVPYIAAVIVAALLCFTLPASIARAIKDEKMRLVTFIFLFTAIEWLRGLGVYGFPAAELGGGNINALSKALISIGGVNFYTLFIFFVSLGLIFLSTKYFRWLIRITLLLLLMSILPLLNTNNTKKTAITVTLVQPADLQGIKPEDIGNYYNFYNDKTREQIITELLIDIPKTDLIILPETAISESPRTRYAFPNHLARLNRAPLLYGVMDNINGTEYNGVFLVDEHGELTGKYHKRQLLPFGEFVPLREIVSQYFTVRSIDLARGKVKKPLQINDYVNAGILICYESLFPNISRNYVNSGANLLVCVTNDAWFGADTALNQHFHIAKQRSIESGVPIVQVGNTGVSGVFDAYNKYNNVQKLTINESGTATSTVLISPIKTAYVALGWLISPIVAIIAIFLVVVGFLQNKREANEELLKAENNE